MGGWLGRGNAASCRNCAVFLALSVLIGCGLTQRRQPALAYVEPKFAEAYPHLEQPLAAGLDAAFCSLHDRAPAGAKSMQVLAVCAGGAHSSFTAGAITGWTKTGNRPTFDVVTGTSSGALVGAFAFLGPKYDARLEAVFTDLSTSEMLHIRPVRYLLLDNAVASSHPLERLIEKEITAELLADLQAAHAQGRRLFVGTTNVETKRLVVWDMGAIASSGRPDVALAIRKIFLASVTWPGVLPPVEFEVSANGERRREQHIDGGATAQAFMRFGPTAGWPNGEPAPGWLAGSDLYVVAGGKVYDDPSQPSQQMFGRVLDGVTCMTGSLARADLQHLHALCMSSGMRFHLLALPASYHGPDHNILQMNSMEMRRLYETGHQMAASGAKSWRHTPPGAEPGEEDRPRGAVRAAGGEADAAAPSFRQSRISTR